METNCYTVGPFAENTYLLTEGDQALLIDPGFAEKSEYQAFNSRIEEDNLILKAVVLTHAHVDHVLGLHKVLNNYEVPVFLSDKDRYLWKNFGPQSAMFGFQTQGFSFDPEPLPIRSNWKIGKFEFDVHYTPGHAPDHVSLYSEKEGMVIAGDALFKDGIGRTDLYKGDFKLLEKSIREQLYSLPDDTAVYPGHGPKTTIGYEKRSNPFVKASS